MEGKTATVTGSNTGKGKETAIELAKSRTSCAPGDQQVRMFTGVVNKEVVVCHLDLASFSSIRVFAAGGKREALMCWSPMLVSMMPLQRSQDGVEIHLAVNYLGHFLLTRLLLDSLKEAPSGRVVNVAADVPLWLAHIDFEDINSERSYNRVRAVVQSNRLVSRHLSRLLENTSVSVYSVSPGLVRNKFGCYRDYFFGVVYYIS